MHEDQSRSVSRKIQQIRLKFNLDYAPYRYFNPHQLLEQLNKAVKGVYDIEFVHVRYLITKNRAQRELNQRLLNDKQFNIDRNVNNILSIKESFKNQNSHQHTILDYILGDAIELKPPSEDRTDFQKQMEKEIVEEEQKKLQDIQKSVQEIMSVYNQKHSNDRSSIRTMESLQSVFLKDYFCQNQYDIYSKGIMNEPTIEKLREQKHSNKPIEIKTKTATLKIYLHPTDSYDTIDKISEELPITSWSHGVKWQPYSEYFSTKDLEKKAGDINSSVKINNYISFGKKNDNSYDSISITSYLWNEIVLKVVVSMAQVKKIQRAASKQAGRRQKEYYFHLAYPPKYYISNMIKEEANSVKFMRSWDRVQNFLLLHNMHIEENYFIRYFVFNNTILKINLLGDSAEGYSIQAASDQLDRLYNKYQGTIDTQSLGELIKPKFHFRTLKATMNYNKFLKKIDIKNQIIMDKVWMIKYLLVVMVRYNYLLPIAEELDTILNKIQEDIEHIDCYLYILWKTATNMWGYTNEEKRFYEYMIEESENLKKMKVKDIMKRMMKQSDIITYIFRASLTPSGYLFNAPTPEMKGRLLKHYNDESQFFLRISFNDESETELKNQKYLTKKVFRNRMNQISILGRKYIPLGWSPSQLRSFSLWYFHQFQDRPHIERLKRDYILSFLGDFSKIDNPAKRAARIGQSFSSSWTYDGTKIQEKRIDDERSETGYLYTDGIGKISADLIEKMSLKLQIRELSVIQMRYKGAKGVLAMDNDLPKNTIVLRSSMIKYECMDDNCKKYLDILDWNKYKAGSLNRQTIILLRTLGIQDSVFMRLQEQHIKRISTMTFKDCSIFKHMSNDLNNEINNLESANKIILDLLKAGFELEKEPFFRGVLETLKKNGYNQLKVKSNILVEKSARIIGIIDEYHVLNEDEVYCAVYDQFSLNPQRQVIEGEAMITRNPCLDPADIRKVTCVSKQQIKIRFENKKISADKFQKFVNCVVFPMEGKYPLTAQISGSDLDGDNFFICWDPRLIPKNVLDPHLIDQPPKENSGKEAIKDTVTYEQMLNFFIDYANYEKLGQIDNSHLVHADRDLINYANNKNCQKLAEIHGKAVDFPKSGYCPPVSPDLFVSEYPDFMEKDPAKTYESKSVLGRLYQDIKEKIQKLLEDKEDAMPQFDEDLISTFEYNQTDKEVQDCMRHLKQYEREIGNLIQLAGVDSQFQIYSGNFSIVKEKVKAFGKNRLIQTIMSIRQRFFNIFFEDYPVDFERYEDAEDLDEQKNTKIADLFSYHIMRKTQLYYLVSYIYRFPTITLPHPKFNDLKEQIEAYVQKRSLKKQGDYCGYVWFITPKVIINMKMSHKLKIMQKEDQKMHQEDQQENSDGGSSKQKGEIMGEEDDDTYI